MPLTTEQLIANLIGSQQIEIIHLKARIAELEAELARMGQRLRVASSSSSGHFIADPADEKDAA